MSSKEGRPGQDVAKPTAAEEPPGAFGERARKGALVDDEGEAPASDPARGSPDLALDEVDVRDLLRRALAPPRDAKRPDVLKAVQRRIRSESKGRFFSDGWSTATAPRATFLITSIVALLVTALLWLLFSPSSIDIIR